MFLKVIYFLFKIAGILEARVFQIPLSSNLTIVKFEKIHVKNELLHDQEKHFCNMEPEN